MYASSIVKPTLVSLSIWLFVAGCSEPTVPPSKGGFWHKGIFFGVDLDKMTQKGIKDGCRTSQGRYTKNHRLFKRNAGYNQGWFTGRHKCLKLLKLDKNGDVLIES